MHTIQYDTIRNLKVSEQASLIIEDAMEQDDSTVAVDIGDNLLGVMVIAPTDEPDTYTFSEWLQIDKEVIKGDEPEDYDLVEIKLLVENRLQQFFLAVD
jgi:hypothetical protein